MRRRWKRMRGWRRRYNLVSTRILELIIICEEEEEGRRRRRGEAEM